MSVYSKLSEQFLDTYDGELDECFGEILWRVLEDLHNHKPMINDNIDVYKTNILIINLLNRYTCEDYDEDLITWGTSIRYAWLTEKGEKVYDKYKKMLSEEAI